MESAGSPTGVIALVIVALVMTVLWLAVHMAGLVVFLKRRRPDAPAPSKLALGAWILGFASGFTGPLVLVFNLVALGLGVFALFSIRSGNMPASSRLPATMAVITGTIMTVFGLFLVLFSLSMT